MSPPSTSSTAPDLVAAVLLCALAVFALCPARAAAQTAFLDFNTAGQYTGNFNPWNDNGGANGGSYSFMESATAGVGGSGGVSVFQSSDTTAAYKSGSWDFSANGAAVFVSLLLKANSQTSGNKIQLGIMNSDTNGLNSNPGVAFDTYRFIPSSAGVWSLREQYRSGGVSTETNLGTVNVTPGRWYKFVVALTNTSGASGNDTAGCCLFDYGTDGLTPAANVVTFSTVQSHTGQDIATQAAVWPALRAFQNAGIDAWDNFLVYTPNSPAVITLGLANATVVSGGTASFAALADGPGTISYSWYTNRVLVPGASGPAYTTPPLSSAYTNVMVVAGNANGSASNSATITVFAPTPPVVTNLPASGIQATLATLNGQVLSAGGSTPTVTLYYGPANGGTNAGSWASSAALGAQFGAFAQTVTGLASNTTYFFTAKAVNASGTAWAAPSGSFTTRASNSPATFVAVLTSHNDLGRTGMNLQETLLNTANVNTNSFGLLYSLAVDDQIYAQPLVMTNVNVPGRGAHNLLIVATVNDTVYAFDADDPASTTPYWTNSFISPPNVVAVRNSDMTGACGGNYQDFSGNMGIVGTPVIDPATGTIYLVARTKENGVNFVQRLHALDITTGVDRTNSPVVIAATYPGSGVDNVGGVITFDPQKQNQRAGLVLINGLVYIAWTSHCDWTPYHGWVMAYDATSLQQMAVYNDTPNGDQAGIWMSNQGPAADTNGNLYLSTGNGDVDDVDRGESFLKLTLAGTNLTVSSWFTPYNYVNLNNADQDLGSGGVLLIPGTTLLFSGGKGGVAYLVDRDNMGGLSGSTTADTNIVQSFQVTTDEVHGGPVWWDSPVASYGYIWPSSVNLQQYQFDRTAGMFVLPVFAQSPTAAPIGQPGGILALSANGASAGTGVLWAAHQLGGDANQQVLPGILHAYDAANVGNELWNSEQISARDSVGNFAKFVAPTVANGKVYLATFSNQLDVYGLFPPVTLAIQFSGHQVQLTWPKGTLQSAAQVSGPYTNVTGAASPYTLTPTGLSQFYRLKIQ